MGTGSSSKASNDDDVRDRLNSGDFQKVSPPSSPSIEAKKDEMSYSGILVEKPVVEVPTSPVAASTTASFAADLRTPPISNRSKTRAKPAAAAAASKEQPRRIVKATPPRSAKVVVGLDDNRNDNESEDLEDNHPFALASPIGAKAASEMLEESIEKNDSKNKLLERVSNKQKSDREKLLQERRRQAPGTDSKPKVEANPFSRFLSAFSVDTNPTHKRKESVDAGGDPNKRLKFGFNNVSSSTTKSETDSADESSRTIENDDKESTEPIPVSWIAVASVATVAVLVVAILRGSKKK
mmetsp:Transcript_15842/g.36677  ORF Transcript_15842/g.36677 Transcript_15842/m.36677 type:complete len:296 (-) Transcript_15842:547-1434(-)|eukprot:CAMPEP_0197187704 /NCGR_PEP_ID=MMETSP1423-20130617/16377_1 /TAXON_ID=476441 /ORGANISM="Pseudo-nitzschia heimii, Strain UNC1101" /LENGTH=295 /DNA_ID=CAMNT_0042639351 /DNA_START=224 /DNA_END=1111 /DNA_ORIENTATION=+